MSSSDDSIKTLITQVTIQERHKADRAQHLAILRTEIIKVNEILDELAEKINSYTEEMREIKIKLPVQAAVNKEAEDDLNQQQVK